MITAKLRHLRISPRKARLVANLVKGLTAEQAERQLKFLTKRAARPILKLLNSALANAQHNANLNKQDLYIAKIIVDPGPSLKRWRARAMGRASPIMKRTSHITLVLEPQEQGLVSPKDEKAKLEPVKEEKVKPLVGEKEEPKIPEEVRKLEKEKMPVSKPKTAPPTRPYPTTPKSSKRFFSRQTFGNVKKYFRRKSI